MATSTLPARVDFADVYAANLDAVWRFVRARIWDHHEAQDVTSDVFLRAWRSWDRFDPDRGPVEPWLFTIAHRTVTDRLRRRVPDEPVDMASASQAAPTLSPEQEVLRDELLAQLAHALESLRPEAQDGLALRFAARLSTTHIAAVLGISVSAAKMMLHRAIHRLADEVEAPAPERQEPVDLEAVIDDVLARGHATMDTSALHGMLVHLAALQSPPTPEGLPHEVARCIECAEVEASSGDAATEAESRDRSSSATPTRAGSGVAALLSLAGVCLACTIPALATVFTALGIAGAGVAIHYVGLAAVPLVLYLVHRGGRRHGHDRGYRWARTGAVTMAVHAVLHVLVETGASLPDWMWVGTPFTVTDWTGTIPGANLPEWAWAAFAITDWVGTPLLVLGAMLNLVDMHRWRRTQAQGLHQLLVTR